MNDSIESTTQPDYSALEQRRPRRLSWRTGLIGGALLALGVAGGATVAQVGGPSIEMAPANPVAIKTLAEGGTVVTVRGKVAEVYGHAFILTDATGRALVEAAHRGLFGGGDALVAVGQTVTVQGHFGDGTLHASFLIGADGKVTALRPMGPRDGRDGRGPGERESFRYGPHGGPNGPDGRGLGFGPDRGPEGTDAPPPPADAPATGNSAG